jgi:HK97 family phage portal protein
MAFFRRSRPAQLTRAVSWSTSSIGLAPVPSWSHDWSLSAVQQVAIVHAAVRAIADDVANVPLRVVGRDGAPVESHPVAMLLSPPPGGPHPGATARQLVAWLVEQWVLWGAAAVEVTRDGRGVPAALWPLPASTVQPVVDSSGGGWWEAFDVATASGVQRLSPEQIMWWHRPSPQDWRTPEPLLIAARLPIEIIRLQQQFDSAFLRNDARPSMLVVHEAFADIEARDAWRAEFLRRHGGPDNAGSTAFVETSPDGAPARDAVAIHPLGVSHRDNLATVRIEQATRQVCAALGVPLSRVHDASARTFSNASEEMRNYWRSTIAPIAAGFADAVTVQLIRDDRWRCEPDTTSIDVLTTKRFPDVQDAIAAVNSGLVTVDEARIDLGFPPATRQRDTTPPQRRDSNRSSIADTTWRAMNQRVTRLERSMFRRAQNLLADQHRSIIDRLTGNRGRRALRVTPPDTSQLFDASFWFERTRTTLEPVIETTVMVAGQAAAADIGLAWDIMLPAVDRIITDRAEHLAATITDTTATAIADQLAEGVRLGESVDQLAARIDHLFDVTWANRAETVARTEVIAAHNHSYRAVLDAGAAAGLVEEIEWVSTRDQRTRPDHREVDGQRIPPNGRFDVGGELLAYPGDPNGSPENTINCRCTIRALIDP